MNLSTKYNTPDHINSFGIPSFHLEFQKLYKEGSSLGHGPGLSQDSKIACLKKTRKTKISACPYVTTQLLPILIPTNFIA